MNPLFKQSLWMSGFSGLDSLWIKLKVLALMEEHRFSEKKNWQSQTVSSSSYRSEEQGRAVLARLTFSQRVSHQSQFGDQGHLAIPSLLCYLHSRTDVFTWSDPSPSDAFSHLWWDKSSTVLWHAGAKASQMDHKRCGPFFFGGRFRPPFFQ